MNAKTNESWRRRSWPNKRFGQVYQAAFPDHLLCAWHCAGFVGDVAGITAMAQSSFPSGGL